MAAKKTAKTKSAETPRKMASKKVAATRSATKKTPVQKASAKKSAVKQTPATKAASKSAGKTTPPKSNRAATKTSMKGGKEISADTTKSTASRSAHSPSFINKQKQRLLDLRDELLDAMSGMTRDTIRNAPEGSEASGSGQHQGDAGSDAYDRDFALSVLAKEQDALYEIEQALRRIQSGSYGICEISGNKIPSMRLEAIPFARLTVECQAQWEKEYGNRRFRPSNEVGFSGGNYGDDEDSDTVSLDEDED